MVTSTSITDHAEAIARLKADLAQAEADSASILRQLERNLGPNEDWWDFSAETDRLVKDDESNRAQRRSLTEQIRQHALAIAAERVLQELP